MSLAQALFMGLLQGASELFPVSSLGHAVIVPSLLHWSFKQSDPSFVPFLVLLHLGTATALLVLYRDQWIAIIRGFFTAAIRGQIRNDYERLAMLLLVGTI
ncbi:MAG TPA: undecaprenyl-diphosphate phosphatase, partial [Candidatus Dormibacteraeota bacterium]|nr:undecaprenyl-diphosphate phosphatase [Candidatus Dormibacteraeota bacterium]